jgi:hypothetical protein
MANLAMRRREENSRPRVNQDGPQQLPLIGTGNKDMAH